MLNNYFTKREKIAIISLMIVFISDISLTPLYSHFPWLDIPFHFLGGFFVALFFIGFLRKSLAAENSLAKDVLLIIGASILVGVLWEFFEFVVGWTRLTEIDFFQDTLIDLVMDMAGAATMFFVVRQRHRKTKMFK